MFPDILNPSLDVRLPAWTSKCTSKPTDSSTKMIQNGGLEMARKNLCAEIDCDIHNEKLTKNDEK